MITLIDLDGHERTIAPSQIKTGVAAVERLKFELTRIRPGTGLLVVETGELDEVIISDGKYWVGLRVQDLNDFEGILKFLLAKLDRRYDHPPAIFAQDVRKCRTCDRADQEDAFEAEGVKVVYCARFRCYVAIDGPPLDVGCHIKGEGEQCED